MTLLDQITPSSARARLALTVRGLDARSALGVFVVLLFFRTFTDASFFSDSISYFLNMGVAAVAIVVALGYTLVGRAGRGSGVIPFLALTTAGFGMLALVLFGVQASLLGEYTRFSSFLAMAVLVRIAVQGGITPVEVTRRALAASTPAIVLVVVGYLGQFAFLVNLSSGRVAGTFNQRNAAAAFVAVFLVAALWAAITTQRRSAWAQVVAGFVALVGTLSLGGLTAAAAGGIVLLLFSLPRLPMFGRVLLVATFIMGAYYVSTDQAIGARLDELNGNVSFSGNLTAQESTNSLQWRIINWRLLLQIWAQRPFFGWGFGSTASIIQPLGQLPHNEYVRVIVEGGIVGAVLAAGFLVFTFARIVRSRGGGSSLHVLGICVMVTALIDAIVANMLSYPPTMYLLVGLVTASISTPVDPRAGGHALRDPEGLVRTDG